MQIEVARIPPEGLALSGDDDSVFTDEVYAEGPTVVTPVTYDLFANYVSGELIVTGRLSATVRFLCSRCAASANKEIAETRFSFVSEAPEGTESVDLTGDMREAILCAFPSHPVCRIECKGLCAQCGKDLNEGECECGSAEGDGWSALGGLKL